MLALNERQQLFVLNLYEQSASQKPINYTDAARAAGYHSNGNKNGMSNIASRLANTTKVQEALAELTTARLKTLLPLSLHVTEQVLRNPQHKDHAKVALSVMDRGGLSPVQKVEQRVINEVVNDEQVLARIMQLGELMGIPVAELIGASTAKVIDVEAEVIPPGLEDVW